LRQQAGRDLHRYVASLRLPGDARFYERCGYTLQAVIDDFYAPGDSKAIYGKVLGSER
jgi:hypothetical protein